MLPQRPNNADSFEVAKVEPYLCRVALAMAMDEAFNPVERGPLGGRAVGFEADEVTTGPF